MITRREGRGAGPEKPGRVRVYSLRLAMGSIRPRIWRRLFVREDMGLSGLHAAIQASFGWSDYQTHVFSIGGRRLGNPVCRTEGAVEDDRDITLAGAGFAGRRRAGYDYLFGRGWHVDLRVERIARAVKGAAYPRCIAGSRAGPPEDCGGIGGYDDMMCCLQHPETDLGREWTAWLGPDFDPEACDLAAINWQLRRL